MRPNTLGIFLIFLNFAILFYVCCMPDAFSYKTFANYAVQK